MDILSNIWNFILEVVLAEFIVVVIGVLSAFLIKDIWVRWRYGGWKVIVRDGEKELLLRNISPGKAKEILYEPAELSVFLKGVASPYGFLNCDILTRGKEVGLFVQEDQERCYFINLDKNPPREEIRDQQSSL